MVTCKWQYHNQWSSFGKEGPIVRKINNTKLTAKLNTQIFTLILSVDSCVCNGSLLRIAAMLVASCLCMNRCVSYKVMNRSKANGP